MCCSRYFDYLKCEKKCLFFLSLARSYENLLILGHSVPRNYGNNKLISRFSSLPAPENMARPEFFYSVTKICHIRKLLVRIFLSSNCSEITYQKWKKKKKILSESKYNLYLTCFHEKVCAIFQQKRSFSFKIFLILRSLHAAMFIQGETNHGTV